MHPMEMIPVEHPLALWTRAVRASAKEPRAIPRDECQQADVRYRVGATKCGPPMLLSTSSLYQKIFAIITSEYER